MKKFALTSVVVLLASLMSMEAHAYDFEVNGLYFTKTGDGAVAVSAGDKSYTGDVTIPASISVDGKEYAVTSIMAAAFKEDGAATKMPLTSISMPRSLQSIGEHAFENCWGLKSVSLPEGIESIGDNAFAFCVNNQLLSLPSTLREIGASAFEANALSEVRLPEGLEHIGLFAFGVNNIQEVLIPSTVSKIDGGCFSSSGSVNLQTIRVAEGNRFYYATDDHSSLIETQTGRFVQGTGRSVIPDDVSCIGERAFYMCQDLKELSIPASVKELEALSLGTGSLEKIYCYANELPRMAKNVFSDQSRDQYRMKQRIVLYVPKGCKEVYAASEEWSGFKEILELSATAVHSIEAADAESKAFTLDGRQVGSVHRNGVYIQNGKKFVVR